METDLSVTPLAGRADRLGAFHTSLAAMAWATRGDSIEDEFWDEVFDALVLGAEGEMGMAQALISGLAPKSLLRILKTVFAGLDYRFGRRFLARRPFQGLAAQRPKCLFDQLAWLTEQADAAVIVATGRRSHHWVLLKDADEQYLNLSEPAGASDMASSMRLAVTAINAKSIIVIERRRDRGE